MGTLDGSAVKIPSTSFQTCNSSAFMPTAMRAAHKSVYPLPISPSIKPPGIGPKNPVITGTLFSQDVIFSLNTSVICL